MRVLRYGALGALAALTLWLMWPEAVPTASVESIAKRYETWGEIAQEDIASLDQAIARYEASIENVRSITAAGVIWGQGIPRKTDRVFVYLHGFSASRMEIDPVIPRLSSQFEANAYMPRMPGHGRDGVAFGQARYEEWLAEAQGALKLAEALGDQVIVIGTSNGGALAHIITQDPDLRSLADGMILVSPNFALNNPAAFLLTWPKARHWAQFLVGKERSFEPRSPLHAQYWTTRYGTAVLAELGQTTKEAQAAERKPGLPTLIIAHPEDKIVDANLTATIGAAIGARMIVPPRTGDVDPDAHVVIGDILSPDATQWGVDQMAAFIAQVGQGA